ncbi:long-chain fatty-acid-CoA ligase [Legionella lansingensis]|uniref:AMP-binding protein n=1 Tax=Legionella lansingensis TaxID=45067 RepID=A0A0W0VXM7_9GAMM|nr:AMP-binding protein [Legionella lansingensis]KTD24824.1 AMP-binding protein [Legionella lansingensis]SNV49102.1 long-chain fatty-acid-CoA ligase [Legionella lansingensis]
MTTPTRTLNQLLLENEKQRGDKIYLRQPREGRWHEFSWAVVIRQARQVARFLQDAGLKKGDHVAIFSKNCAEWFITDFGISLAGMVSVPLFANQHQESIKYVLEHAEAKLVFVGKLDDHQRVRGYIPQDFITVSFGYHDNLNTTYLWTDVLNKEPLQEVVLPSPDDLYTIIYSSGTSGQPKGAVYTHGITANYLSLFPEDIKRIRVLDHYHLLSYLPLAHVYERSAIQLGSITIPSDVSFVESLDKFADNLREVQPTFFAAVPRIWGVFQQKIEQKLPPSRLNILLKIPFISSLIKNKIRHHLGLNRCTNCFSGASHLPVSILNFFDKLDIKIQEGYGQTENLAYATFSMLDKRRPGYVGTPRLQVEVKLADENELMIKSPCLMKEYYKNKEATSAALTKDGWLHTGDIAELDENNNVKIVGRLSENFKNQKGEFIIPAPIEKRFAMNSDIEQLCMVGRELPNNVLVITLSESGQEQSKENIKQSLQENLRKVNSELASYEKISHVIIAKKPWTTENGFLTPTLKVKRRLVETNYHDVIQGAITQPDTIVWE